MQQSTPLKIEITVRSVIRILLLILFARFVWDLKSLLFSLFIAFIVMSAVKIPVENLVKKGLPRKLSVFFVFLLLIVVLSLIVSWIAPLFINETTALIKHFPRIVSSVNNSIPSYLNLSFSLPQMLPNLTNQFFEVIKAVFSNVAFLVSTLVFSIYFTIEKRLVEEIAERFVEKKHAERIERVVATIEQRLGSWVVGEVVLMVVVGTLTFIGLSLIGINYALPLALLAGLFEIIPNIGPIAAAIPAFFVAFSQTPLLGLSSIILALVIQQLENNLVVPLIMKRAVGLHPVITLVALVIGATYGGIVGAIIAIPITLVVEIFINELRPSVG